jgi:hypothetical protein
VREVGEKSVGGERKKWEKVGPARVVASETLRAPGLLVVTQHLARMDAGGDEQGVAPFLMRVHARCPVVQQC